MHSRLNPNSPPLPHTLPRRPRRSSNATLRLRPPPRLRLTLSLSLLRLHPPRLHPPRPLYLPHSLHPPSYADTDDQSPLTRASERGRGNERRRRRPAAAAAATTTTTTIASCHPLDEQAQTFTQPPPSLSLSLQCRMLRRCVNSRRSTVRGRVALAGSPDSARGEAAGEQG